MSLDKVKEFLKVEKEGKVFWFLYVLEFLLVAKIALPELITGISILDNVSTLISWAIIAVFVFDTITIVYPKLKAKFAKK
jgi:hypothetical protein